ncbi:MAG: P-loop NTPase [Candidatus Hadarchaeum sp.]|uniref:P-loop NTPase n=1 Tax=Candidatus Hadarchaeum sp. TaxID=2883567 RepID=UPI003D0CE570
MKEIVVASGKGGTGKTTVAASLAVFLAKRGVKVFVADADVDAPDLLLALGGGKNIFSMNVRASEKARVDVDKCVSCGKCVEVCPFGAMAMPDGGRAIVVELMCEGCGVCKLVCPTNAIEVNEADTGTLSIEETKYGFGCATGKLKLGEHNSGHLVASIRNIARRKAQDEGSDVLIVDAAPGIGCPVIASITGADYVIAVTEPTPAAKRNLERLSRVIKHFDVPAGVVINKSGYSKDFEIVLKDWVVRELGFQFLGEIPIDYEVAKALVQMKPIIEFNPDTKASKALAAIGNKVGEILW